MHVHMSRWNMGYIRNNKEYILVHARIIFYLLQKSVYATHYIHIHIGICIYIYTCMHTLVDVGVDVKVFVLAQFDVHMRMYMFVCAFVQE